MRLIPRTKNRKYERIGCIFIFIFIFIIIIFFFYINLGVSKDEPYFWIDDMFVTGILASKVPHEIKIYNWKNSFLSDHRSLFSIKLTHSLDSHFKSRVKMRK